MYPDETAVSKPTDCKYCLSNSHAIIDSSVTDSSVRPTPPDPTHA